MKKLLLLIALFVASAGIVNYFYAEDLDESSQEIDSDGKWAQCVSSCDEEADYDVYLTCMDKCLD